MFLGLKFAFARPSKGQNNNVAKTHILKADYKECNYEQKADIETNRDKVNVCVKSLLQIKLGIWFSLSV